MVFLLSVQYYKTFCDTKGLLKTKSQVYKESSHFSIIQNPKNKSVAPTPRVLTLYTKGYNKLTAV